ATQFFDALLKAAGLGKERLFIVPGNHDVDYGDREYVFRHKSFREYMAGNVREWCNDSVGSFRVLRGGYWNSLAGYCRSADRSHDAPGNRSDLVGFRLVFVP
ncbi:MAG: SUMF1/EgtB/PvdO family nonheme iron enzyme, partial [Chlorobium sp.]